MPLKVHIRDDGALWIGRGLIISSDELDIRATTSQGPGGQHANRSMTKIVVTWHIATSECLSDVRRQQLIDRIGPVIRAQSSAQRSQHQNKEQALLRLGERIALALVPATPRRPTRPTKASREKRLQQKKSHSRKKSQRRASMDD